TDPPLASTGHERCSPRTKGRLRDPLMSDGRRREAQWHAVKSVEASTRRRWRSDSTASPALTTPSNVRFMPWHPPPSPVDVPRSGMGWKRRARSSAARIAPSKEPPHGPYGCEGVHTQPSEERRHGADTTQNRREASGREEAGEPSEDGAGRGDPTCKECKEPADRQARTKTPQATLTP